MNKEERQKIQKNKELIGKYPWLLPRNRFTDLPVNQMPVDFEEGYSSYDYSYTELDTMPCGWRKAFGEQMCEEIQHELEKFDAVDDFRVIEIKEKYGQLRFYYDGVPVGILSEVDRTEETDGGCPVHDREKDYWEYRGKNKDTGKSIFDHRNIICKCHMDDIIDKYTAISETICIHCGKPATKISIAWISPWCDDCAREVRDRFRPVEGVVEALAKARKNVDNGNYVEAKTFLSDMKEKYDL